MAGDRATASPACGGSCGAVDPGGEPVQVRPAAPAQFDKVADRERNRVERTIKRLRGFRGVAIRYEKRDVIYLAMVTIAAIVLLWLE